MTVSKLIRELEKLKKKVGPRAEISIDLSEFRLIDSEFSHWGIHGVKEEYIRWMKKGSFERADGSERIKSIISIY